MSLDQIYQLFPLVRGKLSFLCSGQTQRRCAEI
jgi:hypothetical protein